MLAVPTWLIGSLITIAIFLFGQLVAGIWWAATITERLRAIASTLEKIEINATDNQKEHQALWKRQDELKERLSVIETVCKGNHQ